MSLISISHLTFGYDGGELLFDDVSLSLDTEWSLGLVGRNGRGKTTLLRLLAGELPHGGSISLPAPAAVFPRPVPRPDLPALEAVGGEEWRLRREAGRLGLSEAALEQPFGTLSGGQRTRLLLAALFAGEEGYPLLDEPTDHLDAPARRQVANYLRQKRGFLLVSHDRALLDACTDHTLAVTRTGLELCRGSFSVWQENEGRREQRERVRDEVLRRDIRQLKAAAEQTRRNADRLERAKIGHTPKGGVKSGMRPYLGEKSRKLQQQRKNLEQRQRRALEEAQGLLRNAEEAGTLKLAPLSAPGVLLRLEELELYRGGRKVCGPLRLEVRSGDRVALDGANGRGKTTLLRLLAGEDIAHTGRVTLGRGVTLSYVPQDCGLLTGSLSRFAREGNVPEPVFRAVLRKLGFERWQLDVELEALSAGQKKKAALARSLCQPAHLYLWDEPLNFVDVLSRGQVEELILSARPTLLFVEHDRAFRERIATQSLTF